MGCDIHMVIEQRHDDRWVGLHAFPSGYGTIFNAGVSREERTGSFYWTADRRNYDLFAALAGVRGEGPEPKGVPEDASDLAKLQVEEWGIDGHSHTHMLLSEAMPIFRRHQFDEVKLIMSEELNEQQRYWRALECFGLSSEKADLDQHRLIIWFDN